MKKVLYSIFAILAIAGCAKEVENPSVNEAGKHIRSVYANVVTDETKATIAIDDNKGINAWSPADEISVMVDGAIEEFGLAAGTKKQFDSKNAIDGNAALSAAVYPASFAAINEGNLSVTIPSEITGYVPGTTNAIMVAGAADENSNFEFHQVAGLLKFTVANVPVGATAFNLSTDNYITGTWSNVTSTSELDEDSIDPDDDTITLTLAETVTVPNQKMSFYVPVPTSTYDEIIISLTNEVSSKSIVKVASGVGLVVAKGGLVVMPEIVLPTETLGGSAPIPVTKTATQFVNENKWTVSAGNEVTNYTSLALDNVVSINAQGTGNNGSFWETKTGSNTYEWRLYQASSGGMKLSLLEEGYVLESVTFEFSASNSGALKIGESSLTSGTEYTFNNNETEATFTVGGTGTKGQIKITSFSVKYKSTTGGNVPVSREVSSIAVSKVPTTTEYEEGDNLNIEGGEITVFYTNNTSEEIAMDSQDVIVSGYDKNTIGVQNVTVIYLGNEVTFKVIVRESTSQEVEYIFNTDAGLTSLGITIPDASEGSITEIANNAEYKVKDVTLKLTDGKNTSTRIYRANNGGINLRIYKDGGSLVLTADSGKKITKVEIDGGSLNNFSVTEGSYDGQATSKTWTGNADSVTFTASGTVQINTLTVTYR